MRTNRYMQIAVLGATILFFALWQTAIAGPPKKPGNHGVPGLLAEIAELNAQIAELETIIEEYEEFTPVPQTGQTECYDTDGNIIDCAGTGQDGEYQYGTPWPEPRFTDNLNGTATDNLTGLVWLQNASCLQGLWAAALTECNTLNSGECGLTDSSIEGDWYLPNIRELQSLIDYSQNYPALPSGHPFTVASDDYWSSTTHSNVTSAFIVNMRIGGISGVDKTFFRSVWCVRGGN